MKIKKSLSILLSILMLVSVTAGLDFSANANETGSCGDSLNWAYDNSTCALTISGTGAMTDYDSDNTSPWNNFTLKSIDINSGVTSIGQLAFNGCADLTSVKIPNSVTTIGNQAFLNCTGLTSVVIGSGLTSAGTEAFGGCSNITNIYYVGSEGNFNTFYLGITTTQTINYHYDCCYSDPVNGHSYSATEAYCLNGCGSLNPDFVAGTYGSLNWAFNTKTNALYINGSGDMLDAMGSLPWDEYKTKIEKVVLGDGVTSIGIGVFANNTALKEVKIASSVASIGGNAFLNCSALASLEIPSGVTGIGTNAFKGTGLTSVKYDSTMADWNKISGIDSIYDIKVTCTDGEIEAKKDDSTTTSKKDDENSTTKPNIVEGKCGLNANYVFNRVEKTITISGSGAILSRAFQATDTVETTTLNIKEGIKTIQVNAFSDLTNLTTVTIPASVTAIATGAFSGCDKITTINFGGSKAQWEALGYDFGDSVSVNYNSTGDTTTTTTSAKNTTTTTKKDSTSTTNKDNQVTTQQSNDVQSTSPIVAPIVGAFQDETSEWVSAKVKSPTLKKLKKAKKALTVYWKKTASINGYQIQYSTSKKFTKSTSKKVLINKQKTTKKTIKKLKSGKKYFVRIRAYKVINGTKVYSKWSKVKSVKVK